MTKLGSTRVRVIRVRGGNLKHRALRLDTGNFSWGTEGDLSPHQLIVFTSLTTSMLSRQLLQENLVLSMLSTMPQTMSWYERRRS